MTMFQHLNLYLHVSNFYSIVKKIFAYIGIIVRYTLHDVFWFVLSFSIVVQLVPRTYFWLSLIVIFYTLAHFIYAYKIMYNTYEPCYVYIVYKKREKRFFQVHNSGTWYRYNDMCILHYLLFFRFTLKNRFLFF